MGFLLFHNYLPLVKGGVDLYLNKFEFLSPKDALCQVSLKLAQWLWRRRLLNSVNVFPLFPWKKAWPFIGKNLNSHHPSLVEIGPVILEKKMKM